jgi:hypothetical protein
VEWLKVKTLSSSPSTKKKKSFQYKGKSKTLNKEDIRKGCRRVYENRTMRPVETVSRMGGGG